MVGSGTVSGGRPGHAREQPITAPVSVVIALSGGQRWGRETWEAARDQRAARMPRRDIPVKLVDLGLVYDVEVEGEQRVRVSMALTAPDCPAAGQILSDVPAARVALGWQ